ncbi:MAG: hypothetical protein J0M33_29025 [Anaerolineae bacterium]|nr:hypothetical protein [Anaerolineae bacterium]
MITFIVEFNEDIGFWQFIVKLDGEVICFRPGFRSHDEAERVGDAWIRDILDGQPVDEERD